MSTSEILSLSANIIAVISIIFAVVVFIIQSKREKKVETIKALNDLFDSYHKIKKSDDYGDRVAFMSKCDRLAVAVNGRIYDISIVRNRASKLLHDQYDKYMRDYIEQRRKQFDDEGYYSELEKLIHKI